MTVKQFSLPYSHDTALLFACVKDMPWPMLLDSGQAINPITQRAGSQFGRYDILVASPIITLVTQGNLTTVCQNGHITQSEQDPFALIKQLLNSSAAEKTSFPFTGGALGYFGYDLARRLERLPSFSENTPDMPEMMVGIYDWAVIVDHRLQETWLVSHQRYISDETWQSLCTLFSHVPALPATTFHVNTPVQSNMDAQAYAQAFDQVKDYIQEGDCYQVNLAQRFSASVHGDSWQCYLKFRELSPAPFMAYMDLTLPQGQKIQLLSVSPERFLQLVDGAVETRPIKGTRSRSLDAAVDASNAMELLTSTKDRAENLMIVDLLRNDIGKVCEVGSVKAEKLFNLQSFANVHHLVSFVTGRLRSDSTALDLLRSCFPGGSITGAPKLRAMQIIEELEPHRRGVYCGCIGYVDVGGDMDTNIAIRTAVIKDGKIYFYAGGGVVADSTSEKEYKETFDKASNFLTTMQYFMSH